MPSGGGSNVRFACIVLDPGGGAIVPILLRSAFAGPVVVQDAALVEEFGFDAPVIALQSLIDDPTRAAEMPKSSVLFGDPDHLGARAAVSLWRAGVRRLFLKGNWASMAKIMVLRGTDCALQRGWSALWSPARRLLRIAGRASRMMTVNALSGLSRMKRTRELVQSVVDRWARIHMQLAETVPLKPVVHMSSVPGRVFVVNSALAWGGAERQVVNTLAGLRASGVESITFCCEHLGDDPNRHFYLPMVEALGVPIVEVGNLGRGGTDCASLLSGPLRNRIAEACGTLPSDLQRHVVALAGELVRYRPSVVHAWQDSTNIAVGFAAILAGVPRVLLSTRNVSPPNFLYWRPYMRRAYRALLGHPSVTIINNSLAGRDDYCRWLGVDPERFLVIRNGIDDGDIRRAPAEDVEAFRERLRIPAASQIVGAVFRFYPEKRPLLWVRMAARVAKARPQCHFFVAGTGPLQPLMTRVARRLGVGDRLHFPGTMADVSLALSAMDVFVLTSRFEGTPNVALEAQLLGIPVVATDAGGTREAIDEGRSGWVVEEATSAALAERVCAALDDSDWRKHAREAGPRFVHDRFGLERMVRETRVAYGMDPAAQDAVREPT